MNLNSNQKTMNTKAIFKTLIMCAFLITSFKVDAQDWANLKRYQAENAELKTRKSKRTELFLWEIQSHKAGWKHGLNSSKTMHI